MRGRVFFMSERMNRLSLLAGILTAGILCPGPASSPAFAKAPAGEQEKNKPKAELPREYEEKILPILTKYCHKCHNPEKKKGELDLTAIKTQEQIAGGIDLWQKAVERLNAFEMPPEKSPQPSF